MDLGVGDDANVFLVLESGDEPYFLNDKPDLTHCGVAFESKKVLVVDCLFAQLLFLFFHVVAISNVAPSIRVRA